MCKMPPVYYCVYLVGSIDYFFLLYWNRSEKDLEYSKRLKKSSIGIGTLKNAKQVLLRRVSFINVGAGGEVRACGCAAHWDFAFELRIPCFFVLFFVSIIQNVSLAIGGLCSMMVFGILAADLLGVVHLLPKKSISLPWSCSYLASLFLVLISIPAANSTAFCYIESATAEFEVIDRDFAHDGNKHQV